MDETKISIIVPVYNSEKYIVACIDSLVKQEFNDFEIILVDDGSTDNSGKLCEKYAAEYDQIILITKENGGLCSARNAGIDIARGEYLLFIDNDDKLEDDALSIIWRAIRELECDILRFNRKRVQIFKNGKKKEDIYGCIGICSENEKVVMTRDQFFENYRKVRSSGCFSGIWNGIFKKSLFSNLRFNSKITAGGEDWIMNLELYNRCSNIGFISDVLYTYYRRMAHSVSTTYQDNRIYAIKQSANIEKKLIEENNVAIDELLHINILYISQIIKIMMHPDSGLNKMEKLNILREAAKEPGLNIKKINVINANIPLLEKIYLLLYKKEKYSILIKISEIILKCRGNT
ncbi:glycosyltransferase family 2 protein [Ruminococcus sp. AF13-28]|nr:glycosyltransferase family 2 protein [Ruminococcus sp. AF13-28]